MNISKFRRFLYQLNKILGDIDAARKGRVKQRIYNRIIGKMNSRIMTRFFK